MDAQETLQDFRKKWFQEINDTVKVVLENEHKEVRTKNQFFGLFGNKHSTEENVGDFPKHREEFKDILGGCSQEIICEFPSTERSEDLHVKSTASFVLKSKTVELNKSEKRKSEGFHEHEIFENSAKPKKSKRLEEIFTTSKPCHTKERYLDAFIADLDEINEIPFFDIELPRELAINIFNNLSAKDLCRCAQVSRAWRSIAEDELLWCRISHRLGLEKTAASIERQDWKSIVRSQITSHQQSQHHWKNRIGSHANLDHIPGGYLRSVNSHENIVVAGYSSKEVKLWKLETNESCIFSPSGAVSELQLNEETGTDEFRISEVACTSSLTAALFTNSGSSSSVIEIWNNEDSSTKPQCTITQQSLAANLHLFDENRVILTTTVGSLHIWQQGKTTRSFRADTNSFRSEETSTFRKIHDAEIAPDSKICQIAVVPLSTHAKDVTEHCLVCVDSNSSVKAYQMNYADYSDNITTTCSTVHDVYLQHVKHMQVTCDECVLDIHDYNPGLSENMYTLAVYDLPTQRLSCRFSSGSSILSCLHTSTEAPCLIAAGTYNVGIKLWDQRLGGKDVIRLRETGHSSTHIQMDDWKLVSGSLQGYVLVWDYRMPVKCWDWHSRCPVEFVHFSGPRLITAHIPNAQTFNTTDEDGMTSSRYRGSLHVYDFRESQESNFLPTICHSDYDMPEQYNYNIKLAVPYDKLV